MLLVLCRNKLIFCSDSDTQGHDLLECGTAKQEKSIFEFALFQSAHDVVKIDGRQDENAGIPKKAFGGKPRNQPFTIYVDQDSDVLPPSQGHASAEDLEVDDDLENHMPSLSEAVMRLPSIPQPQVRVPEAKGEYCLGLEYKNTYNLRQPCRLYNFFFFKLEEWAP